MTVVEIRELCFLWKGVTEDIKWGNHLCFSVGKKLFLVINPEKLPMIASFKVSQEDFWTFYLKDGFSQAPHFAKNQWIHVDNIERMCYEEWKHYLQIAYQLIFAKLTKKLQQEIASS